MKLYSKILLKTLAFAVGIYFLYRTVEYISWHDLWNLFVRGGVFLMIPILVYPFACVFQAIAIKQLLSKEVRSGLAFSPLYSVRMTGDALNKMTPFAEIGGEPLKAWLLHERKLAPLHEAITAVWLARIGIVATEILFVFMGYFLMQRWYPSDMVGPLVFIGVGFGVVYLGILITGQMKGAVWALPAVAKRFASEEKETESLESLCHQADQDLKNFYQHRKRDFTLSLVWNFLGWFVTFLEVYLFFRVLGIEISVIKALIFQSLLQVIKTATFLIPGNIGVQEGGLAYLATHLGFSAVDGFALSLMKRFRQLVWVLFGLLLWKIHRNEKA